MFRFASGGPARGRRAGWRRRSLAVGVAVACAAALGLTACEAPFVPKPCPTALYQPTTTFADGQAIINDCAITIRSQADVTTKRNQLLQFIWGPAGFPAAKLPTSVDNNVASPVAGLTNLERVDTLHIAMDAGQVGLAYHFIPLNRKANRLVVLHQGHACTFDDSGGLTDIGNGMQRTINSLLSDGYSVLAVYMQHMNYVLPNDCGVPSHDEMFQTLQTEGSVLKFFLEPVAVSLNYLQTQSVAGQFPRYQDFSMIGLSGGGWTTVVYAAIDPRIKLSFPVAGSLPLYLRFPASEGDTEQNLSAFYSIAGYPDLHVLGSAGPGRRQVQILNRRDDCCFGEQFHRADLTGMSFDRAVHSYEWRVRSTLAALTSGSFRLEVDEPAPAHMISWSSIASVILAELNEDRRTVGASTTADTFVRGSNGNLWHHNAAAWEDTGLPMVGAPAVSGGGTAPVSVFYRDTDNHLMRAYVSSNTWRSVSLGGVVITDPVAGSTAPGQSDVVALGADYTPYHFAWNGTSVLTTQMSATRVLGQPAMTATPGRLDVFVRGFDRTIRHLRSTAGGVVEERLGGVASDFPSATVTSGPDGTTRRVFVHGQDNRIWGATSLNDGPWKWEALTQAGMTDRFAGSPSASMCGTTQTVFVRTRTGNLGRFRRAPSAGWTYTNLGSAIADSPTAIGNVAYAHGQDGTLQYFDGIRWQAQGGRFD